MSKGNVLVWEAMKTNPITVKPDTPVMEVAIIMRDAGIGNCIVLSKKPIGIITESDIIKKVVSKNLNARKVKVEDIMSSPIIVINPKKNGNIL